MYQKDNLNNRIKNYNFNLIINNLQNNLKIHYKRNYQQLSKNNK